MAAIDICQLVGAVADEGAAEFAESANAEVEQTESGGFPLYVLGPPNLKNCVGLLDVSDGQLIYFSYAAGSSETGPFTTLNLFDLPAVEYR